MKYEEQIADLRKKKEEEREINAIRNAAEDSWEKLKGSRAHLGRVQGGVNTFKSSMNRLPRLHFFSGERAARFGVISRVSA